MINTNRKHTHRNGSIFQRLALLGSLALFIAGCGKDSGDGDITNTLDLPLGELILDLYCEDFGLFTNTCVLDDPDNPYVQVNINNENRFTLNDELNAAVAADPLLETEDILKTRVYFWATALAKNSNGENQIQTAKAMYALANRSCSDLIRDQALRAYRSVLDNYFNSETFFATDDFGAPFPNVFYPYPLKLVAVDELRNGIGAADPSCGGSGYSRFFFDPDPGRNNFVARVKLREWGYIFDDVTDSLIRNE